MQDIDFGRFYRERGGNRESTRTRKTVRDHSITRGNSQHGGLPTSQKLLVYGVSGAILLFTLGMFVGSRWERNRLIRQVETETVGEEMTTANVSNTKNNIQIEESLKVEKNSEPVAEQSEEKIRSAIEGSGESYLILARIYSDQKEAYSAGRQLMKTGLPVFLAKNGKKLKVYVGPVQGKNEAYQYLAQVKNISDFKGAVMYKK
ncbi:MAG: SPOR domain-containing protein [Leptospiraceae bacterium]|nr:SPOR domain-containing protein [Leptospiraceae bacterium]MCB1199671.1 SPOR domain-containing protein [Leptospiraceae bacterium]